MIIIIKYTTKIIKYGFQICKMRFIYLEILFFFAHKVNGQQNEQRIVGDLYDWMCISVMYFSRLFFFSFFIKYKM